MLILRPLLLAFTTILCVSTAYSQENRECIPDPDAQYPREVILRDMVTLIKRNLIDYPPTAHLTEKAGRPVGFFVYDLTDTSNKDPLGKSCIDFLEGHIYHFSPFHFNYSMSFFASPNNGTVKYFEKVNCGSSSQKLKDVVDYYSKLRKGMPGLANVLRRIKNYWRYSTWPYIEATAPYYCKSDDAVPPNPDKDFDRYRTLHELSAQLEKFVPNSFREYRLFPTVANGRGVGFYIQDLVDTGNKQGSLLDLIELKEGHFYQFGWLDAPFSLTHFLALQGGKVRFFSAMECGDKARNLGAVEKYLGNEFDTKEVRIEILVERVRNFEKFRLVVPFEGSTVPRWDCNGGNGSSP